jgi:hypothetical protein
LHGRDDAVGESQVLRSRGVEVSFEGSDLRVDSGEGVLGDLVEDRSEAVGEYERAGDERDAEHHRHKGQDEAAEMRADPADDESEHDGLSRRAS